MSNIRIRCDGEVKGKWYELLNRVDADLNNDELVEKLYHYFDEDESRIDTLRRANEPPGEFR